MAADDAQRISGTTVSERVSPVTASLREDRRLACPPEDLLERPKMAAVEVGDPASGRGDVAVFCPARQRYVRVQGPQWAFLRGLDGRRTIAELERDFSGRLPDGMVRPLLARFAEVGLLEGGEDDNQGKDRRLRVADLGAIQLSLVNPDRFLDRLIPLIRTLGGPVGRTVSALVMVVGLYSTAVHARLAALCSERLAHPMWTATLAAALLGCVVLHELGHAAAVKYFGGKVRRMGVMLFYLAPAMFCDTSDAWRFPRNRQRAVVAAAGIWVQMVLAGLSGLALWLPVGADVAAWLWALALLNVGLCVVNLVPFVQLDGYWVLVALTDVHNLRSRALGSLRAAVLRVVAGVAQPEAAPPRHPVLTMMFGLGCALFPPVLILTVLLDLQHALLRLGRVGAAAWLLLAGSVAVVSCKGLMRIVGSARCWPSAARWRAGVVGGVLVLVVGGVLAAVRIPLTVQGRFEVSDAGEVIAVLPAQAHAHLGPGDRIQLRGHSAAEGMLAREVQSDARELRYRVVLDGGGASQVLPSAAGLLSARAGEAALPAWFLAVYLQPALSVLGRT
ncbi:MAG: daptide biosynthesis intramembrane metalloprotease [Egibacteraceae bacterium]